MGSQAQSFCWCCVPDLLKQAMSSGWGYIQAGHACPCVTTISLAGMHVGPSEWDLMGMSPWRRVANPIILHHSSPISLALGGFFSIGDWWLQDLLAACVSWLQNASRARRGGHSRQPATACDPVSPSHADRNSFMTRTFGKHQNVAWRQQIRSTKGGSLP